MRLIDADELLQSIGGSYQQAFWDGREEKSFGIVEEVIIEAPTVDAAPVVHGRWTESEEHRGWKVCSVCHNCYVDGEWAGGKKWQYCPDCGARMDLAEP